MGKIKSALTGTIAFFISAVLHAALIGGIIYASGAVKTGKAPVRFISSAETARSYALLPDVEIISNMSALKRNDGSKTAPEKKEDFGTAKSTETSGGDNDKSVFMYQDAVKHRLQEARIYPEDARKEGTQGTAEISFSILPDGTLDSVSLTRSSGREVLDAEAISTVKRASPFPPFNGNTGNNKIDMQVAIVFKLN